jgi:hypothetical protein
MFQENTILLTRIIFRKYDFINIYLTVIYAKKLIYCY